MSSGKSGLLGHLRSLRRKPGPKRISSEAPWREVVWIDSQQGDRGGTTWALILECGHYAFRPMLTGRGLSDARKIFLSPTRGCAPKRVRCRACESGIASCDPAPLIALREGSKGA